MTSRTFYLVWCPNGPTPPTYRHETEGNARREAERLAREKPGQEFFVLRSTGVAKKVDVVWIDHEIDDVDTIPF